MLVVVSNKKATQLLPIRNKKNNVDKHHKIVNTNLTFIKPYLGFGTGVGSGIPAGVAAGAPGEGAVTVRGPSGHL